MHLVCVSTLLTLVECGKASFDIYAFSLWTVQLLELSLFKEQKHWITGRLDD